MIRVMHTVNGLHHVTAIAGPAQENLDFYAGILGMRLVKSAFAERQSSASDEAFRRILALR